VSSNEQPYRRIAIEAPPWHTRIIASVYRRVLWLTCQICVTGGRQNVVAVVKSDGKQVAKLDGNADNVERIEKTSVQHLVIEATKLA
jgi:hypothetical protein